jgi:hypothetical protein
LFSPWLTLEALKTMSPGPTEMIFPLSLYSSLPLWMNSHSLLGCLCGGCGVLPTGSTVSWISTNSPVGSVPDITGRCWPPLSSFTTGRSA